MSRQSDLAFAHQKDRIALGRALGARLDMLWRRTSVADLSATWDVIAPQMVQHVANAQLEAVSQSTRYLGAIDRSYGYDAKPAELVPAAFSNVMGDGREVAPALYGAVTNTKELIGKGIEPLRAFESGASFLSIVAQAALQDMGRSADRVLAAGKGYTRYIRVVNGAACSRCAILAGIYSGPEAFRRHVGCQCGVVPIQVDGKPPKGFHTSADAYFQSLSKAEQDRVFTNAGAEAIRQGANPTAVVNARRGAYGIGYSGHTNVPVPRGARHTLQPLTIGRRADGSPLRVYATTEGTTARGQFYKQDRGRAAAATKDGRYTRTTTVRLMPEQIAVMAGGDNTRWVQLLRKYGYLD